MQVLEVLGSNRQHTRQVCSLGRCLAAASHQGPSKAEELAGWPRCDALPGSPPLHTLWARPGTVGLRHMHTTSDPLFKWRSMAGWRSALSSNAQCSARLHHHGDLPTCSVTLPEAHVAENATKKVVGSYWLPHCRRMSPVGSQSCRMVGKSRSAMAVAPCKLGITGIAKERRRRERQQTCS